MRRIERWAVALLALAVFAPLAASAEVMVVVNARGIGLAPGTKIDAATPLVLAEGQHVTLVAVNGVTLKLDGPFNKPPSQATGGGVATAALGALVTQQGARTSEVGVTRAGGTISRLPDPWLLDVSRSGTVCLLDGKPAVFWRPSPAKDTLLSLMPADRSWKADTMWPAGSDRLEASGDIAVHPDSVFFISFDGGEESAITVNFVPANLDSDPMRAAWLADQGCEAQAEAMLRSK
jgi:hypothetical protein